MLTGGRADHLAGQGLIPRTTAYVLGILKSVLADAVEDDVLSRNPAEYVRPPIVQERLGHTNISITLDTCSSVRARHGRGSGGSRSQR